MQKGISIRIINDSFSSFNKKRTQDIELADGIALSAISASRQRLQQIAEQEDLKALVSAVEIEIDILSYAAERYADLNSEELFDSLSTCIEDYNELREELLSMKE